MKLRNKKKKSYNNSSKKMINSARIKRDRPQSTPTKLNWKKLFSTSTLNKIIWRIKNKRKTLKLKKSSGCKYRDSLSWLRIFEISFICIRAIFSTNFLKLLSKDRWIWIIIKTLINIVLWLKLILRKEEIAIINF